MVSFISFTENPQKIFDSVILEIYLVDFDEVSDVVL